MDAVDKAMETAKKLAGTNVLAEELRSKEAKLEEARKEQEKTAKELQNAQMQVIQTQLGSKIDQLSEAVKSGASAKSIGDQIADIKKAAGELGLGTSKISEFKDIANLIQSFNPQKGLAEQIKDAKDLLSILQPEKGTGALVEGVPAAVAVELKKLDADLKIRLEQMADARQISEQNFKITLLKFEEDRDIRRQEVDGKILMERERNQLISGALKTIGESIGKGLKDATTTSPGGVSQGTEAIAKHYRVDISKEKDLGKFPCPNCHNEVGIGPTSTTAQCVGCNSQFEIVRDTPQASAAEATSKEVEQ
jgi:hypothetical protein